ncbi:hypothetical protein [Streptomyces sp. NBC_01708]|uniref:hypothetical protein n=1 Tax=Streptomyces sp. NBC_01708 TaxID=2975915 RepID=UPI002E37864A|nr:hypothetical protein [Streptomyces sp. NBC_01708]
MARTDNMIRTRVCIDDMLGPFDCKLDPSNRWNGWMSPHFTLDTVRELSHQTLRMADEYGYDCTDTIHVIDGREDSRDTVHIIERGPSPNSEGHEMPAIAVRIRWSNVTRDAVAATTIGRATPNDRKAARRSKATGRGAQRSVVIHIRWQWIDEDSDTAATAEPRGKDGLYAVGGWEWTWHYATWWCPCGADMDWHLAECTNCHLTRDTRPEKKPCDCGCDPVYGAVGQFDTQGPASLAHLAATGRYLRWTELIRLDATSAT